MRHTLYKSLILLGLAFAGIVKAEESPVITLGPTNCVLRFEVPSTWGSIKGEVPQLTGQARYGRYGDLNTLQGQVEVTTTNLTTRNEDLDEKIRKVALQTDRFPTIIFQLQKCTVFEGGTATFLGLLKIGNVTKRVVFGAQYTVEGSDYKMVGGGSIKWAEYGIRDISTMFSKLQPPVKIALELTLPRIEPQ